VAAGQQLIARRRLAMAAGRSLAFWAVLLQFACATQTMPWETTAAPSKAPVVPVKVLPRLAPIGDAEDAASEASKAQGWAAASSDMATERLRAAKASTRAVQGQVEALDGQIASSEVGDSIQKTVEKVRSLRVKTLEAARHTGRLVGGVPEAIQHGVKRAVDEVVTAALKKLEADKASVTAAAESKLAAQAAGASGSLGAGMPPLQKAGTVDSFSNTAAALAGQVNQIKQRAIDLGNQAIKWQASRGDMIKAQDLQMQAHGLMDKAAGMSEQAQVYNNVANLINQEDGSLEALRASTVMDGTIPDMVPVKLPEPPCPR